MGPLPRPKLPRLRSLAVKNLASLLPPTHKGVNGYQQVYAEMYHRYDIRSYWAPPRKNYDEVVAWLHEWYDEVTARQGRD